jgi:hypothetical protein
MNEEYLWSKKGSDPEIEKLEMILREFRFEPGPAPVALPAAHSGVSAFFAYRLTWISAVASPSFALVLFGFWLFAWNTNGDLQPRSQQVVPTQTEIQNEIGIGGPIRIKSEENIKAKPRAPSLRSGPRYVKTVYRSKKTKADPSELLTAMNLTSEEKYAYDRLMLALSIAGTKLKVVQDTIDRNGDLDKTSVHNQK